MCLRHMSRTSFRGYFLHFAQYLSVSTVYTYISISIHNYRHIYIHILTRIVLEKPLCYRSTCSVIARTSHYFPKPLSVNHRCRCVRSQSEFIAKTREPLDSSGQGKATLFSSLHLGLSTLEEISTHSFNLQCILQMYCLCIGEIYTNKESIFYSDMRPLTGWDPPYSLFLSFFL